MALPRRIERIGAVVLGIYVFLVALELLKSGAKPAGEILENRFGVEGVAGWLGWGWLLALLVLSGSPVAATSLGMLGGGQISPTESYAMIVGSRIGASFVVLVLGFVYDLRRNEGTRSTAVGVTSLWTTASVYVPSLPIGLLALSNGWLSGLRFGSPQALTSWLARIVNPVAQPLKDVLPPVLLFVAGILVLLGSFKVFDRSLPDVDPGRGRLGRMATVVFKPWIPFALGLLVTAMTLSVSVSLSLLVPLTVKGYVRRENLVPYVLGANITTFVDTLFASLFVDHPDAFAVVFAILATVTALTLPLVFLFYGPYERFLHRAIHACSGSRRRVAAFVAILFAIPLALIFLW
jgi:Na+/phosphate symporter